MGFDIRVIDVPNGLYGFAKQDRITLGLLPVAYGAGTGAGAAVTVSLDTLLPSDLPSTAAFFVGEAADVTASISGGSLVVEPRLAASTIAAGTVNVLVVA